MKNIFKAAIFVMAMMISATMALGQDQDGDNSNQYDPNTPPLWITVNAVYPPGASTIMTATMTYYYTDKFGESPSFPINCPLIGGDYILFGPFFCSYNPTYNLEIHYRIDAYDYYGHHFYTCGSAPIYGSTIIEVTTWNYCGGPIPHYPNTTE
jgi:hypothetical protein